MERPDYFSLENGKKSKLPFSKNEYERRLKGLREIMNQHDLEMVLLTSMHGVAYYSGFLYTSFGRPYGCVVLMKNVLQFLQILMLGNHGEDQLMKI